MPEELQRTANLTDRLESRRAVLRRIEHRHRKILARRGGLRIDIDPADLIEEIREERNEELFGCLPRC